MRILITTPSFERKGGVANYLSILKRYFTSDVEYFTVGSRAPGEGKWESLRRFIEDGWNFYRKLKENSYDIIHLNPSLMHKAVLRDGILLFIAKKLGYKVVVFFHGWDKTFQDRFTGWMLKLFRYFIFEADAFVVLASEFKDKLSDMGCSKPIFLETTVVDDSVFSGFDAEHGYRSLNNIDSKLNILFLSRIERTKGVYEAIGTYRKLKAVHPSVTLTIAGDGSELGHVKRYVNDKDIDDIEFLGYVSGRLKYDAFTSANVYLFPSYSEGMPISVLEAMACGLPIVTRPVGGIRDFFENGKMGYLTESKDPKVFAELIEKLIMLGPTGRREIGQFNRCYAKEHFLASKAAGRIEDIYRGILSNRVPKWDSRKYERAASEDVDYSKCAECKCEVETIAQKIS